MSWLQKHSQSISSYLYTYKEVPDYFGYYKDTVCSDFLSIYLDKIIPSEGNSILYEEMSLLHKGYDLFKYKFKKYNHFNIFDLASTTGDTTLPLLLDIIEEGKSVEYCPITPNILMNMYAIKKLQAFAIHSQGGEINSSQIVCEFEHNNAFDQISSVKKKNSNEQTATVYLLLDSRLGNSLQPEKMLKNIYDSMSEGDFFVLVQSVYSTGIESKTVHDFTHILENQETFIPPRDIMSLIDSNGELQVKWVEDKYSQGIKLCFTVTENKTYNDLEFKKGEEISVFRSERFSRKRLENMLSTVAFKTKEILFSTSADNVLYLLEK